jgi:hypothetical protein
MVEAAGKLGVWPKRVSQLYIVNGDGDGIEDVNQPLFTAFSITC